MAELDAPHVYEGSRNEHAREVGVAQPARAATHATYPPSWMWQPCVVTVHEPTREELEAMVATLREEVSRLKEEVRRLRHDAHEVPPHYL